MASLSLLPSVSVLCASFPCVLRSTSELALVFSDAELQSVAPRQLSLGGGTAIALTLYGASDRLSDISVTVNSTVKLSASGSSTVTLYVSSVCTVTAVSGDIVTCVADRFPHASLANDMAAKGLLGYNVSIGGASVSVAQLGLTTTLPNAVQYEESVTPYITGVAPSFGPAYGGTVITITGSGFNCSSSNCSVMIGGAPCRVQTATDDAIVCVTSAHTSGHAQVLVAAASGNAAPLFPGADQFRYVLRIDVIAAAVTDEVYPALIFSVTPTISVTPSITSSTSFSSTHTRTPSVTASTSPSVSSSKSLSPSTTGSVSQSSTPTVSVTISITKSTTKSPSISASSTTTPFKGTSTRSLTSSQTASVTVSVSDSKSASETTSRTGTRSSTRTSTVSPSITSTTSVSGTVSRTRSMSMSSSASPSISPSASPSSWAPVVGMGGDVELDLSGQGFGNASFLETTAKALGLSQQQAATHVNALLYDPAVDSFTIATTAFDATNPLHPAISDVQVVSLRSADRTYEIQQIQIISPNNTGGTFNISTADGKKTTQSMVFLANATTMYDAITTLGLAPDIEVSYSRIRDANGTDNVTWIITFLALAPVEPVVLNTQNLLFGGVQYSVTRLRRGVVPFSGTWRASIPTLGSSITAPIQFNASADDVRLALLNITFPSVYGSLQVFSVDRTESHGDPGDFQGAGSTTWTWTIVTVLHPFEGVDPNGRLPALSLNGSGFVGGFGVTLSCNHSVIGQAGWRSAHGSYLVASVGFDSVVTLNVSTFIRDIEALLSSLAGVIVLGVEVRSSAGWATNDYGYGVESGYGVGLTSVLDGLGAAITLFVTYAPANAVDVCTVDGFMQQDSLLVFDGAGLMGTNITWAQKSLQSFRCVSLDMRVNNHTDTNLRVHLPSLQPHLLDYPAQYRTLIDAPHPVGWWRSLAQNASTGTTGPFITEIGTFPALARAVGSISTYPGFSARDSDAAMWFTGLSSVEVPYR